MPKFYKFIKTNFQNTKINQIKIKIICGGVEREYAVSQIGSNRLEKLLTRARSNLGPFYFFKPPLQMFNSRPFFVVTVVS